MKVAVVGATGLVGTRMLEVLAERNFPVTELLPVASAKSVGRKITFQGKEWTVISAEEAIAEAAPQEEAPVVVEETVSQKSTSKNRVGAMFDFLTFSDV